MLNTEILPIVLKEEVKWNTHGMLFNTSKIQNGVPSYLSLSRNLRDDTFDIEASDVLMATYSAHEMNFTINDKAPTGILQTISDNTGYNKVKVHRGSFSDLGFSKLTSLGFSETTSNAPIISIATFPEIAPINKNIKMDYYHYIELQSINYVRFNLPLGDTFMSNSKVDILTEVSYNHTYLFPRKLKLDQGNKTLFDVYVKNDENYKNSTNSIYADYSMDDGKIITSSMGKTSLKTYFKPTDENEVFLNAKKVGTIEIFDSTYYNYETKKVERGYTEKAEQGILVPYNFSGEYKEQITLSVNSAFKNLNINISTQIEDPLLDKFNGREILSISEIEKYSGPFNIIPSDKIEILADNDPTIHGLLRMSHLEEVKA